MIALILLASVLIAIVTIFQYREEAVDYHRERLQRKEANITTYIIQAFSIFSKFNKVL